VDEWGLRLERIGAWLMALSAAMFLSAVFGPGMGSWLGWLGAVGLLVASLMYGVGAWLQTRAVHEAERTGGR
jgi:hypothetical protein